MHFSNTQFKKSTKGGSVLLLNKIKKAPLPVEGGAILSNRIVGITSNAVRQPPKSMAMASTSVGGMLDFNKHVKKSSINIQKKKDKEENIKFVY
jgi:hypothetical protein